MSSKEFRNRRSARIANRQSVAAGISAAVHPKDADENKICQILTLNDDCLLEIFSYFDLTELCAVKECCRRFSFLANFAAATLLRKDKYVEFRSNMDMYGFRHDNYQDGALKLMKFGEFMVHIEINYSFIEFCNRSRSTVNLNSLMEKCSALKSLKLNNVDMSNFSLGIRTIEKLELWRCQNISHNQYVILKAPKMMKHLMIESNAPPLNLIPFIVKNGKHLESISLVFYFRNSADDPTLFEQLFTLRKLKKIEFRFSSRHTSQTFPFINILAKMHSVEELCLEGIVADGAFFTALNNCDNLKVFKLITTNEKILQTASALATNFIRQVDEGNEDVSIGEAPVIRRTIILKRQI